MQTHPSILYLVLRAIDSRHFIGYATVKEDGDDCADVMREYPEVKCDSLRGLVHLDGVGLDGLLEVIMLESRSHQLPLSQ